MQLSTDHKVGGSSLSERTPGHRLLTPLISGFAEPRLGAHSHGIGACREDGDRPGPAGSAGGPVIDSVAPAW